MASVPIARVLLAAPVLYELRRGVAGRVTAYARGIDQIAESYEVAGFDGEAADAAARIALAMRRAGRTVHHLDAMIAGIAVSRPAILVTRDKNFAKAPGLKVENWH